MFKDISVVLLTVVICAAVYIAAVCLTWQTLVFIQGGVSGYDYYTGSIVGLVTLALSNKWILKVVYKLIDWLNLD
jgi:hypothetical protein